MLDMVFLKRGLLIYVCDVVCIQYSEPAGLLQNLSGSLAVESELIHYCQTQLQSVADLNGIGLNRINGAMLVYHRPY